MALCGGHAGDRIARAVGQPAAQPPSAAARRPGPAVLTRPILTRPILTRPILSARLALPGDPGALLLPHPVAGPPRQSVKTLTL